MIIVAIRIILADDHKIVRQGLRILIEKHSDLEVIGEAEDGWDTVRQARELSPQVIIMDVAMPKLNGIEATSRVLTENPQIKVIGLSMHSDKRFVVRMLQAGASGYLLKEGAAEELILAIHKVMDGKTYLSHTVSELVVQDYLKKLKDKETPFSSDLTTREREVLQLVAEGKSTKETAFLLGVSIKTGETFRQHIMDKLNIHSIAGLTKYAIREGLTSPDI